MTIMSMGIVDNEDFEKELGRLSEKPIKNPAQIIDINRGRGNGNNEVPESLRKVIGEESIESGRASALGLARAFGISDSSVSAYSNGSTSTSSYNNPDKSLKNHVQNAKRRIARSAREKLTLALSHITTEKLVDVKARELAGIAKDMSAVVRNMEPETIQEGANSGPKFIIYAPQFRSESSFDVVNVIE